MELKEALSTAYEIEALVLLLENSAGDDIKSARVKFLLADKISDLKAALEIEEDALAEDPQPVAQTGAEDAEDDADIAESVEFEETEDADETEESAAPETAEPVAHDEPKEPETVEPPTTQIEEVEAEAIDADPDSKQPYQFQPEIMPEYPLVGNPAFAPTEEPEIAVPVENSDNGESLDFVIEYEQEEDAVEPPRQIHAVDVNQSAMLKHTDAQLRKAFTLNDKFRFRRELFGNSEVRFSQTLDILSTMRTTNEADEYLFEDLGWDRNNADVKDFVNIVYAFLEK